MGKGVTPAQNPSRCTSSLFSGTTPGRLSRSKCSLLKFSTFSLSISSSYFESYLLNLSFKNNWAVWIFFFLKFLGVVYTSWIQSSFQTYVLRVWTPILWSSLLPSIWRPWTRRAFLISNRTMKQFIYFSPLIITYFCTFYIFSYSKVVSIFSIFSSGRFVCVSLLDLRSVTN